MSLIKKVKLRAFAIENPSFDKTHPETLQQLRQNLLNSKSVNDRKMALNENDEENEADLISYFDEHSTDPNPLFCTMLRIAPGDDVDHVSDALMSMNKFTLDELETAKIDTAAICIKHYYFTVSKHYLVTNLPGNQTIKQLQVYLNWLLNSLYELTPLIDTIKIESLGDLKQVAVQDFEINPSSHQGEKDNKATSIFNLNNAAALWLKEKLGLKDVKGLTEVEIEQIISAKLVIQFKKPKKNDPEEIQKVYGALLKPVADLENVAITDKNNKILAKGKDIAKVKEVDVDVTSTGKINEQSISQEMRKFLLELEHEKANRT